MYRYEFVCMIMKIFLEGCPKNWQQCFFLESLREGAESEGSAQVPILWVPPVLVPCKCVAYQTVTKQPLR